MRQGRGFSLIELMVALSIAVLLIVLALPGYSAWVADGQITAMAESIASGMRFAYAEAIKENRQMEFVLDPTTTTGGWQVNPVGGAAVRQENFAEGSKLAQATVTPAGATTVTFTALGTINATNANASAVLREVAITFSGPVANTRPLTVLVGGGRTGIKICDPSVTVTTSARYCTT